MLKCKICGKECLDKGFGSHLSHQHKTNAKDYYDKYIKSEDEGKCVDCGADTSFGTIKTGYAKHCKYCAKLLGLEAARVKYGGAPAKNPEVMAKMKATCMERYGAENVYASEYGKAKIKETCQKRYGTDYVSQSQEFKDKIDYKMLGLKATASMLNNAREYAKSQNKILQYDLFKKYGVGWFKYYQPTTTKYNRFILVDCSWEPKAKEYFEFKQNNKSRSFCEHEIIEFIKTIYSGPIITNTRTVIKPYELDIYLPDLKIAIEENDSFWHSDLNPFSRYDDYETYHKNKQELCDSKNIDLIVIDRKDWLSNKAQENLKNKIKRD